MNKPYAMLQSRLHATGALPLWPAFAVMSVLTLVVQLPGPHATAWHFFDDAASLLLGHGPAGQADGLQLYRDRPDFQFGPLSVLAAVPLSLTGLTVGAWLAMLLSSLAGLVALALLVDTIDTLQPGFRATVPTWTLLVGGGVMIITWGDVAVRTAHIDDAIAWLALVAALRWCARRQPWAACAALTVAAAAKPWAIMFAPLALLPLQLPPSQTGRLLRKPGEVRRWLVAQRLGIFYGLARVVTVGVLAGLTWMPFILAEPATLDTRDFGITNDGTSVLRALGVDEAETPAWARPAQMAGGFGLVGLLVLAGRWPAALLAGVAWRLLLEPGANRYYTIGLVIGALVVELLVRRHRIPWFTVAGAVVLELTAIPGFWDLPGRYLRLACVTFALAVALSWLLRDTDQDDCKVPDETVAKCGTKPLQSAG